MQHCWCEAICMRLDQTGPENSSRRHKWSSHTRSVVGGSVTLTPELCKHVHNSVYTVLHSYAKCSGSVQPCLMPVYFFGFVLVLTMYDKGHIHKNTLASVQKTIICTSSLLQTCLQREICREQSFNHEFLKAKNCSWLFFTEGNVKTSLGL